MIMKKPTNKLITRQRQTTTKNHQWITQLLQKCPVCVIQACFFLTSWSVYATRPIYSVRQFTRYKFMLKLRVLFFSPTQRLTKNYLLLRRFQDALPEQNLWVLQGIGVKEKNSWQWSIASSNVEWNLSSHVKIKMYSNLYLCNFSIFKVTNLHGQMNLKFPERNHGNLKSLRKYLLSSSRYVFAHTFRKLNVIRSHYNKCSKYILSYHCTPCVL